MMNFAITINGDSYNISVLVMTSLAYIVFLVLLGKSGDGSCGLIINEIIMLIVFAALGIMISNALSTL
jgi:uncharacterized membrane protein YGL010W